MPLVDASMENLPVEVMVDILSRLPVKTIIQCKCVCKKWLDLVSDSYFADFQLSRSPAGIMIYHDSDHNKENTGYHKSGIWVEVEDKPDHHNLPHNRVMSLDLNLPGIIHPVGSLNGLICLWQYNRKTSNTYICNPITREYMILPKQKYHRKEIYADVTYGFGVSSVAREYKVIRILQKSLSPAEVYTLGTGQWRSLGHVPYWFTGRCGQFLNGHAHWTIRDQDSSKKICALDFDKETFELFPSPPPEEAFIYFDCLGVVRGCLCRCDTYYSKFTVWVMKEYGVKKSWHKEFVIERCMDPNLDLLRVEPLYPIEGFEDGTILMASYQNKVFVYCPQRKTIVDREVFGGYFYGLSYHPSFLRLHNFENGRVQLF
ncbi:unnamed protein product [Lactuca virosa]|uniref:F-box domain-containing protein n=1 Tax=Lactuca virosa TaxID=75947 RepID=A0AAU9P408_9ASTR|nr:unnamed protein product [Lactuca virosa]